MKDKDTGNLLTQCLRLVRETAQVGIGRRRKAPPGLTTSIDAMVDVHFASGREAVVCVNVKRTLRPAHLAELEYAREQCRAHSPGAEYMVVASAVSEPLAQGLRNRGIWFADTAGNLYLERAPEILVFIAGRKPAGAPTRPRVRKLSAEAARLLFQVLRHGPDVKATYRDLAAATEISLGMISKLVVSWLERGWIQRAGRGAYRILDPAEMLQLWCDAYADTLAARLRIGLYRSPHEGDVSTLLDVLAEEPQAILGGELAADVLTSHLRADRVHLYVLEDDAPQLRRSLRLAPSGEGSIELRRTFSTDVAGDKAMGDRLCLAHPILVYAELMGEESDRLGEVAARLRREHLEWTL